MSTNRLSHKDRTLKKMSEAHIIDRLIQHFLGTLDPPMDAGQINIGLRLANKLLPDLKAIEQTIKDDRKKSKLEVDAALIANGIDPEKIWKQVTQH